MIEEEVARRGRLQKLREAGIDPYPTTARRDRTVADFLAGFDEVMKSGQRLALVGRLKAIRKHGGLTFLTLEDGSGAVQLVLKKDQVGEEGYLLFHSTMDMGDFILAEGTAFITKKEEKSLNVEAYQILSKALLPMPEKWHGLSDTEIRYRQRYLDLIANEQVRAIFRTRAKILSSLREFLDQHGFLEVETPVLQAIPGGANARPFSTHHNALDADLYLRIAPELYLKQCIIGGFERVYEVARCFRNEGIDHAHNPEFTQIEGYAAYMDYRELMDLTEEMVRYAITSCGLDPAAVPFQGQVLNFSGAWPRIGFRDLLLKEAKIDIEDHETREAIAKVALKLNVPVEKTDSRATIIDTIYKHLARPKIIQPTFIIDYPAELSPLAKRRRDNPKYVEMFQLVYGGGVENIKAFSELNDPLDQEERFKEQQAARAGGDEEAQFADDDFVTALKHGMPPTAGFGLGIDRLAATLTNTHNIKEVILFPTLRPEK